ncbi:MAG TPA: proton-conducting transporter membrane subunit, partial [Chthonomonadales bacterium]|nr:proton-conducting transporter membrane subunit [Chthonomonadales bacterium]
MNELASANLVWLIPGLPLLGFLFHAFLGKKAGKQVVGLVGTGVVFAAFLVSVKVLMDLLALPGEHKRAFASLIPGAADVPWIEIGSFQSYYRALLDPLSLLMCLIVTGVGGLIHLYATGYMAQDRDYARFFTYFNLFIFFMLMLVLGENILLMFVGWEGVGLCSYLLIAFWYEDIEKSKAGNKAFIVNRIGDVGFALGIMAVFATFGTLAFYTPDGNGFLDMAARGETLNGTLTVGLVTLIALLLFVGATG